MNGSILRGTDIFRRRQEVVSGMNILRPFLNSLYGRLDVIKNVQGQRFIFRRQ